MCEVQTSSTGVVGAFTEGTLLAFAALLVLEVSWLQEEAVIVGGCYTEKKFIAPPVRSAITPESFCLVLMVAMGTW